jgi:hypothetical protein
MIIPLFVVQTSMHSILCSLWNMGCTSTLKPMKKTNGKLGRLRSHEFKKRFNTQVANLGIEPFLELRLGRN